MNKRKISIIAFSVAVVTFIVFLPALQNEFLNWDDIEYISGNSFIRSLDTQLLKSAFLEFHAWNWHPLTWLSHAVDYSVWGLNPLGHHLTNNILHALNTFLVILLVVKLIETVHSRQGAIGNGQEEKMLEAESHAGEKEGNHRGIASNLSPIAYSRSSSDSHFTLTAAVTTGLLFGLHPLHVESVAWAAERKDLLCAFFFLLTIITYVHYVIETSARTSLNYASRFFNRKYLYALGFFILALLSKPMAVSLPFVLLILDWYPFKRIQSLKTFWTTSVEKLPFLALTLASSVMTVLAQQVKTIGSLENSSLSSRVLVAAKALGTYLGKMLWPLHLVPYYPYPENISLFSPEYLIPIVSVITITAACIVFLRKQKLWMSVWSYYVITLMPVLGIVQVGPQAMADRYSYLPSIGPFLIIGLMTAKVYEKVSAINRWRVMSLMACFIIAMTILVSLSYATIKQIGIWKNSIVFWNYVIEEEPSRHLTPYISLGMAYASKGLVDMAIEQYQNALRLDPNNVKAHMNLGLSYLKRGSKDMARIEFETVLIINPNNSIARRMLFSLSQSYN